MPRGPELSRELNKYIYDRYIFMHMSERAIMRSINENTALHSKFGDISPPDIHYHVAKIKIQLEETLDMDAIDKYTAEYVRFQTSIESEIEDVQGMLDCTNETEKEVWIRLKRLKKELMETKLKALQDHELPLVVRKLKREREMKGHKKVVPTLEVKDAERSSE